MSNWLFGLQAAIALLINLSLGIYILVLNPRSRINRMYFLYTLTITVWLLGASLQRFASRDADIILWQKLQYMGATLVPPMYLLFLKDFLSDERNIVDDEKVHIVTFGVAFVLIALLPTHLFITNKVMHDAPWGYGAFGPLIGAFVVFFFSCILYSMAALYFAQRKARSLNRKKALTIMWVSTLLGGLIGSLTDAILPTFGVFFPIADVLMIPFVGAIAYTIYRYRLFRPVVRTQPSEMRTPPSSQIGFVLHTRMDKLTSALADIKKDAKRPRPMLVVSAKGPGTARKELGLNGVDVLWVTDEDVDGAHFNNIQLGEIREALLYFIERNPHAVIAIPSLESIISKNVSQFDDRKHLIDLMADLMAHSRNYPVLFLLLGAPEDLFVPSKDRPAQVAAPFTSFRSLIGPIFEVVVHKVVMALNMSLRDLVQSEAFIRQHIGNGGRGHVRVDQASRTLVPEGDWDKDDLNEALRSFLDSVDKNKRNMSVAIINKELSKLGIDHHSVSINRGVITLFRGDDQHGVFNAVKGLAGQGPVLVITRSTPDRVRRIFDLPHDMRIVWWSQEGTSGNGNGNGNVSSLEHMESEVREMFEADKRATVLIDGLDTLVQVFGLDPVFTFVQRLHDEVATSRGRILFTVGKEGLPQKELRLLSKNMDIHER